MRLAKLALVVVVAAAATACGAPGTNNFTGNNAYDADADRVFDMKMREGGGSYPAYSWERATAPR